MQPFSVSLLLAMGLVLCWLAGCQSGGPRQVIPLPVQAHATKFIQFGWGAPAPTRLAQQQPSPTQFPFDGVVMRIPGHDSVFAPEAWSEQEIAGEMTALAGLQWGACTENFIVMNVRAQPDWWDDSAWLQVTQHVRLLAKAAAVGRCRGLCWDPEPYGPNPWCYPEQLHAGEKSFAQYQAITRRRGAQFMDAMQQEFPSPTLLALFQLSILAGCDPRQLPTSRYGLLPSFLDGMLDAATPETVIIDGNEPSYFYTAPEQFSAAAASIHQTASALLDPANAPRYAAHLRNAQAVYFDLYFFANAARRALPDLTGLHDNLTAAAQHTDGYVWCWGQQVNWWQAGGVPAGLAEAITMTKAGL